MLLGKQALAQLNSAFVPCESTLTIATSLFSNSSDLNSSVPRDVDCGVGAWIPDSPFIVDWAIRTGKTQ